MEKSTLNHYAKAFFSLAKEENKISEYSADMDFLYAVFSKEPKVIKYLESPMVTLQDKENLLDKYFKDKVQVGTIGYLRVLIKKKAIKQFSEIYKQYKHCFNEYSNIVEGRIYTPYMLEEKTLKKIEQVFSKKLNKKIVFKVLQDSRVIAGMKIYIEDTLYDYSIDTEIDNIKSKLLYQESL